MVSPLQSIVANTRAAPNPLMGAGDLIRQQKLTDSTLQTQDMQRQGMQQQMDIRGQNQEQAQKQFSQEQAVGAGRYLNHLGKQLLATPEQQWGQILQVNLPQLQELGYTPEILQGVNREAIQGIVAQTEPLVAMKVGGQTAEQRNRQQLLSDLKSSDPNVRKSAEIELGLTERAGTRTGTERIATTEGLTEQVATSEATRAGAKEEAKLTAQFNLKPQVAAAVTTAVEGAKNSAAIQREQRSNDRALDVYDSAMANLTESLGGTITGPGVGWLPAVTSDSQIAQGAMAALAPVLKSIFRVSGEGSFTDKDQELLMQMVPTRSDLPEARAAKIAGIDAIVRAKLGRRSEQTAPPQQAPINDQDEIKQLEADLFGG